MCDSSIIREATQPHEWLQEDVALRLEAEGNLQ